MYFTNSLYYYVAIVVFVIILALFLPTRFKKRMWILLTTLMAIIEIFAILSLSSPEAPEAIFIIFQFTALIPLIFILTYYLKTKLNKS